MTGSRAAVAATVAFAWVATFAFGALISETLLLYPNIFADVPGSLVRALDFLAVTAPNDVLPPLGAATIGTAAAAVALTLRRPAVRPWTIGAALALVLGELLFSAVWFWPRNTIMFVEGSAVHDAVYLQQVAAEFQAGHWVRVAMGLATAVLAFTGMLRMHREVSCEHSRTRAR
jgi:hypothetical protein